MTIYTLDESQRKAARVAGFTFLSAMAIVVLANYGISFRLSVPGSAVDTARNIMAHETLFRLNIACNLLYLVNGACSVLSLSSFSPASTRRFTRAGSTRLWLSSKWPWAFGFCSRG